MSKADVVMGRIIAELEVIEEIKRKIKGDSRRGSDRYPDVTPVMIEKYLSGNVSEMTYLEYLVTVRRLEGNFDDNAFAMEMYKSYSPKEKSEMNSAALPIPSITIPSAAAGNIPSQIFLF